MLLMKAFSNSNMKYENKIKLRILISILLVICGAIALTLSILYQDRISTDFMAGFYSGTGGGFTGCGLVLLIYFLRLLSNKEKMKKKEVEENDERNKFVSVKASSLSFFITLFALYVGVIITGLFSSVAFFTLLWVVAGMMLLLLITLFIFKKVF